MMYYFVLICFIKIIKPVFCAIFCANFWPWLLYVRPTETFVGYFAVKFMLKHLLKDGLLQLGR